MAKPNPRCIRCNQRMRNDGTVDAPVWVCNNHNCVRYVPEEENKNEDIENKNEENKNEDK